MTMLVDRWGRKIDYLRVSVTDRCNLRCEYCMPEEGVPLKEHGEILSYERITEVVRVAVRLGIERVRLTGGEPLVRKGVVALVGMLSEIEGLREVAMTTNGVLLTPPVATALKKAGLARLNISLDTLDPVMYGKITRGGEVGDVLRAIVAARDAGFSGTKINMVVPPRTAREEIERMRSFCEAEGLVLQTINRFSLSSRMGGEGFDRPLPCWKCNRLRLTADGFIKPCLFSDVEIPVDFDDIEGSIIEAVAAKPAAGTSCSVRTMSQIGG